MSALAEMLVKQGAEVSGSDISVNIPMDYFNNLGIKVNLNQEESNIVDQALTVVISSAIKENNNELLKAKRLGCPIIKRGQLLAQLMQNTTSQIGVIGTHGKTTTTSLIVSIFQQAFNPSYFIGGHFNDKPHAKLGTDDWFISELDESDGSFLEVTPTHGVITNIEHDHIDYYSTKDMIIDAFEKSIFRTLENGGQCAINLDDPISEKIYKRSTHKSSFITYAVESEEAQIRAKSIDYDWQGISFDLIINDTVADKVQLQLFGRHNIYNALAAAAIAIQSGLSLNHILLGLSSFKGVKRRLELKYKANEIVLYDDYAHHPTEILTTLEGIYKSFSNQRIITVFQPHRYSRLTSLFDQFATSFQRSSLTYIVPVFAAGESQENHKSSSDLVVEIQKNQNSVSYCETFESVVKEIQVNLQPKDIIVLMGAGSITKLSKDIIPVIKSKGKKP